MCSMEGNENGDALPFLNMTDECLQIPNISIKSISLFPKTPTSVNENWLRTPLQERVRLKMRSQLDRKRYSTFTCNTPNERDGERHEPNVTDRVCDEARQRSRTNQTAAVTHALNLEPNLPLHNRDVTSTDIHVSREPSPRDREMCNWTNCENDIHKSQSERADVCIASALVDDRGLFGNETNLEGREADYFRRNKGDIRLVMSNMEMKKMPLLKPTSLGIPLAQRRKLQISKSCKISRNKTISDFSRNKQTNCKSLDKNRNILPITTVAIIASDIDCTKNTREDAPTMPDTEQPCEVPMFVTNASEKTGLCQNEMLLFQELSKSMWHTSTIQNMQSATTDELSSSLKNRRAILNGKLFSAKRSLSSEISINCQKSFIPPFRSSVEERQRNSIYWKHHVSSGSVIGTKPRSICLLRTCDKDVSNVNNNNNTEGQSNQTNCTYDKCEIPGERLLDPCVLSTSKFKTKSISNRPRIIRSDINIPSNELLVAENVKSTHFKPVNSSTDKHIQTERRSSKSPAQVPIPAVRTSLISSNAAPMRLEQAKDSFFDKSFTQPACNVVTPERVFVPKTSTGHKQRPRLSKLTMQRLLVEMERGVTCLPDDNPHAYVKGCVKHSKVTCTNLSTRESKRTIKGPTRRPQRLACEPAAAGIRQRRRVFSPPQPANLMNTRKPQEGVNSPRPGLGRQFCQNPIALDSPSNLTAITRREPTIVINCLHPRRDDQDGLPSGRAPDNTRVPCPMLPMNQQTTIDRDGFALPRGRKFNPTAQPFVTSIAEIRGGGDVRATPTRRGNLVPTKKLPFLPHSKPITTHRTSTASHFVKRTRKLQQPPKACDPNGTQGCNSSSHPKAVNTNSNTDLLIKSPTQHLSVDETSGLKATNASGKLQDNNASLSKEQSQSIGKQVLCAMETGDVTCTTVMSCPSNLDKNLAESYSSHRSASRRESLRSRTSLSKRHGSRGATSSKATHGTTSHGSLQVSEKHSLNTGSDGNTHSRLNDSNTSPVLDNVFEKPRLREGMQCNANTELENTIANGCTLNDSDFANRGNESNLATEERKSEVVACVRVASAESFHPPLCPAAIMTNEVHPDERDYRRKKAAQVEHDEGDAKNEARAECTSTSGITRCCSPELARRKQVNTLSGRHRDRLSCGPVHITAIPTELAKSVLVSGSNISPGTSPLLVDVNDYGVSLEESSCTPDVTEKILNSTSGLLEQNGGIFDYTFRPVSRVNCLSDVGVLRQSKLHIALQDKSPERVLKEKETLNCDVSKEIQLLTENTLQLIKHIKKKMSATHLAGKHSNALTITEHVEEKPILAADEVPICKENTSIFEATKNNVRNQLHLHCNGLGTKETSMYSNSVQVVSNSYHLSEKKSKEVVRKKTNFTQNSSASSQSMLLTCTSLDSAGGRLNDKCQSLVNSEITTKPVNAKELKFIFTDIIEKSISECLLAVTRSMQLQNIKKLAQKNRNRCKKCHCPLKEVSLEASAIFNERNFKTKDSIKVGNVDIFHKNNGFCLGKSRNIPLSTETEGYIAEEDTNESEDALVDKQNKKSSRNSVTHRIENIIIGSNVLNKNIKNAHDTVKQMKNKKHCKSGTNHSLNRMAATSTQNIDSQVCSNGVDITKTQRDHKKQSKRKTNSHYTILLSESKMNSSNFRKNEIPYISSEHVRKLVKDHIYAIPRDEPQPKNTERLCEESDYMTSSASCSKDVDYRGLNPRRSARNSFGARQLRPRAKTTHSIRHRNRDRKRRTKRKQNQLCLFGWTPEVADICFEVPNRLPTTSSVECLREESKTKTTANEEEDLHELASRAKPNQQHVHGTAIGAEEAHGKRRTSRRRDKPKHSPMPSVSKSLEQDAPTRTAEWCAGGGTKDTLWAVTRINMFQDGSSTYEIMEPSRRRPKNVPKITHNIFVVSPSHHVVRASDIR